MKIAIIGTSNIGPVKSALPEIARDWPDLQVTCFGLPGGRFARASVDERGVFRTNPDDPAGARLARKINGTETISLARFDHVLVVGDGLGLPGILFTAAGYDIAEWDSRRGAPLLSEAGFLKVIEHTVTARVADLARQFADIRPLSFAPAPYPTVEVVPEGPHHQQPFAAMAGHPEAGQVEGLVRAAMGWALGAQGIGYVPQPPETVDRPFLTRAEFANDAEDFRTPGHTLADKRHMNAAFGASLFRSFALGLSSNQTAPDAPAGRPDS